MVGDIFLLAFGPLPDFYGVSRRVQPDPDPEILRFHVTVKTDQRLHSLVGTFGDIWTIEVDGTNPTQLTHKRYTVNMDPSWSPDGKKIAFSRFHNNRGSRDAQVLAELDADGIYTMDADGKNLKWITNHGSRPAWSPDGTKIAFISLREGTNEDLARIMMGWMYVMDADGKNVQQLTTSPTWSPSSWRGEDGFHASSPDGKHIAFVRHEDGIGQIYTMNPDGKKSGS